MGGGVSAQLALVAGTAIGSSSRAITAPIGTSPWPSASRAQSSARRHQALVVGDGDKV